MTKKLKYKFISLFKKENGFTLVELLAVLVILAIIVAIAVPAVGNVIDNAQVDADEAEVELIEDAAKLYFIENTDDEYLVLPDPVTGGENGEVSVGTLIDSGYLDVDDESIENYRNRVVRYTKNDEGVNYSLSEQDIATGTGTGTGTGGTGN